MRDRNALLQWGVGAILIVVPLLSSEQFFFASTFTQAIAFWLGAYLVAAVTLAQYAFREVSRPLHVRVFAAFVAALSISAVLGGDVMRSMWSTYERMWGIVTYVAILGLVVAWSTVFRGREQLSLLLRFASGSVLCVSAYALGAWMIQGASGRIDGSIGNAAFLASFLMLGIFVLFSYGATASFTRRRDWLFWYAAVGLAFVTLLLTGTRGSLLGLFAGGGALMMLTLLRGEAHDAWGLRRKHLLRIAKIGVATGLIAIALFIPLRQRLAESQVSLIRRIGEISLSDRAAEGRLLNWGVAWKGIVQRPIFGWGPEQYYLLYDKHYDPRLFRIEPWVDRAHNGYLDMLAVGGGVGFVMYLGVLFVGLYGGWKLRARMWALGNVVIASIIAYMVNALFLFDTLWTWTPLLLLVSIPYLALSDGRVSIASRSSRLMRGAFFGVCGLLFFWYGIGSPVVANVHGKNAYDALAGQRDDEAFRLYAQALRREQYGSVDIDRSLAEYVFDFVRKGGQRDNASLIRITKRAQEAMDRNIAREPENGKWWLWAGQLASLHTTLTEEEKESMLQRSVEYLLGAHERMPNRPQVLLELAQVYRVAGDTDRMGDALDRAIALLPMYPMSHTNAAVQYIYSGDSAREARELEWLRTKSWAREGMEGEEDLHSPERDQAMLRDAYYNVERFRDAVRAQEAIVVRREEAFERTRDAQELISALQALAAIQARAGDRAGARVSALRVADLAPALRGEVETFLKGLGF